MALLNTLKEQLAILWSRWSGAQRIGISAAAILSVAILVGTFIWATQPDYRVLASNLTPAQAAEIVGVLETERIPVKQNYSGSTVSVPYGQMSSARLALKDVLDAPESDDSNAIPGFPGSPRQEEDTRRRTLERRLAKSIEQIRGIRTATVHISQPDPSPFAIEQDPATASILIDPAVNVRVSMATAQSIVSLVANAVEGLTTDNVTLTDTAGHEFSMKNNTASLMGEQLEYQLRLESHLKAKAESLLTQSLGSGRAQVMVSADIDFRKSERTETTYDPDLSLKVSEEIKNVSSLKGQALPIGEAGTAENVKGGAELPPENGPFKSEFSTVTYQNSGTTETIHDAPGTIKRLTVSTVVDLSARTPAGEGADTAAAAAPTMTLEQVEQIVRNAVGFDEFRSDEITVVDAPLEVLPLFIEEDVPIVFWEQHTELIQSLTLGIASLLAFIIAVMVIRRMKPVVMTAPLDEPMSMSDMKRLRAISDQAREHPEVVAKILSAWIEESEKSKAPSEANTSSRPPRRRAA